MENNMTVFCDDLVVQGLFYSLNSVDAVSLLCFLYLVHVVH